MMPVVLVKQPRTVMARLARSVMPGAQPGDVIVHHANTVHGATGNSSRRDRRAFSLHYLGDDVRYREREGVGLDYGKSHTLRNGDVMDSAEFPLVWTSGEGYLQPVDYR